MKTPGSLRFTSFKNDRGLLGPRGQGDSKCFHPQGMEEEQQQQTT